MSQCKPIDEFTPEEKKILRSKAVVSPRADDWNPFPQPVELYRIDENDVCWFPFALKGIDFKRRSIKDFEPNEYQTTLKLYTSETDPSGLNRDQDVVLKEALVKLKKDKHVFLNLSTGFGKSATITHLASYCKRGKTLVAVFNGLVQTQMVESFKTFSNAKVQHIKGKKQPDPDANVYVIGLKKAAGCEPEFFKDISMMVIDEVDQLPAKTLLKFVQLINPVYLVGMSATINRDDNMHQALYSYFGPRNTFIKRFIVKDFDVIKYQTNFKPEVEYLDNGKVNNTLLTDSIAYNEERHQVITNLVKSYSKDKILILSKRVAEIEMLYEKLKESGESVDYKNQRKLKWDTSSRVLIGGFQSCGRGVDIPGLSVLILASSVNHIEQNEGRIRMNENLIIDIVDNHAIFESRFEKRKRWYKKRGAKLFYQLESDSSVKKMK